MFSVSVVVPVFNSEQSLDELYRRLVAALVLTATRFEIIFVDDGGRDNSWKLISKFAECDNRVLGLLHSRNYGQHNAVLTGIRAASNEVIVTLDDDLQNPPEEMHKLLAALEEGYDVVYGTPETQRHGLLRDCASVLTKVALQSAMGARTARDASAYRAFRTFLRDAFTDYHGPFVSVDVLLTWGTTSFSSIRVKHDSRQFGPSHYTLWKLVQHALNMMTGFSVVPLQLASLIGFLFTVAGLGLLTYVLANYFLRGTSVAGFTFVASMIAIFSGAQMFALGMMGEYIARIHQRSMGQPSGMVRAIVTSTKRNSDLGNAPRE